VNSFSQARASSKPPRDTIRQSSGTRHLRRRLLGKGSWIYLGPRRGGDRGW